MALLQSVAALVDGTRGLMSVEDLSENLGVSADDVQRAVDFYAKAFG